MKRFIACFILSLIGLSMLMQPSIMAIDQDLDTIATYNPFYHVFYDTTLDETTWVKGSYIETPYLITDSTYIGGKVKISDAGVDVDVVAQAFKAEYNVSSQLGAYAHGVKIEHTRTANIQPVTGCWFGGQFVLNAGTTAWDDINKPAYAIQGIIKGDQWDGVQDVNAARFELQSSGSVRDIVYILANSGTSVSSSMLYMPTHISLTNMIQLNAQSSSTITNAIDILSGVGSSFNYGIDFGDATINTADIKFGNGALIYNKHVDSLIITEANVKIVGNLLATTYLDLPKVDSAVYADSSGWSDLLDGYSEDYFVDTNDAVGLTGHDSTNFLYSDTVDIGEFISQLGIKVFDYNADSSSLYIGEDVGGANAGLSNVYIGNDVADTNIGKENVAIGQHTMQDAASAFRNIAIGSYALGNVTTGSNNMAIGYEALRLTTDGTHNVAIGSAALKGNVSGIYNLAFGAGAMEYSYDGTYNIAIGGNAFQHGGKAGADDCIALGSSALRYDSIGGANIGIGKGAGNALTSGINNIFMGSRAGYRFLADYSIFLGNYAGYSGAGATTAADYNIGMGYRTLYGNTSGSANIALGREMLFYNTTGAGNIMLGYRTGYVAGATDLDGNVVIGHYAGRQMTGDYNVFLGYTAGYYETGSNKLHIAVSNTDSLIYGEFDNHYVWIKDSLGVSSIVTDKIYAGGGEQLVKFTKIGSHCAIILNASADTFWIATDTTGF